MENLIANGHTEADGYPLWLVWYRNRLAVERENTLIVTKAIVFQAALGTTAMTTEEGGRKAVARFEKLIKGLTDVERS